MAFDNNKTRIWDRQTLNDGELFDDEFERVYTNLNDLNGRVINLNDGITNLTSIQESHVAGILQGGAYWDKTGGAEGNIAIRGGRYEVAGKLITLNADITLNPVNNNYGNDATEPNYWYYTLMDQSGNMRTQLAQGTMILDALEINSVSDLGGGNHQITFRNNPLLDQTMVGKIFRSDDLAHGNSGLFKITVVEEADFRIQLENNKGSAIPADTNPVGTGGIYESVPFVNTPNPAFSIPRQGFYDGDWRILGIDHYDTSREYRWVKSYKSGYDRNDNELYLKNIEGYGSIDNSVLKYKDILKQWGHDYTYTVPDGSEITFLRSGKIDFFMCYHTNTNSSTWRGLTINANAAQRKENIWNYSDFLNKTAYGLASIGEPESPSGSLNISQGDIVRIQGNNRTPISAYMDADTAQFRFTPD